MEKIKNLEGSIAILGDTGSGKTVFLRWFLEKIQRPMIILDFKHTKHLNGYGYEVHTLEELYNAWNDEKKKRYSILFRPITPSDIENLREYQRGLAEEIAWKFWNLKKTKMYIVIDELRNCVKSHKDEPPGLYTWLSQGRELKKDLIFGIQRPQWVSVGFIAEARHIFHFQTNEKDIELLSWLPYDLTKIKDYQYYHYDQEKREAIPHKKVPFR